MEEVKISIDGKDHVVKIEEEGNTLKVHLNGKVYTVEASGANEQKEYDLGESSDEGGQGTIKAHLPGVIFSIEVKEGDTVEKDQKLLSLVAMKMENQVKSPVEGTVKKIAVKKDQKVGKGDLLLIIE